MAEAGKGSTQRPTDQKSYSNNWDKIFGKSRNKAEQDDPVKLSKELDQDKNKSMK